MKTYKQFCEEMSHVIIQHKADPHTNNNHLKAQEKRENDRERAQKELRDNRERRAATQRAVTTHIEKV